MDKIFFENMKNLFQDEYEQFFESITAKKIHKTIRVNTLKISKEDFIKLAKFDVSNVKWCDKGLYIKEDIRLGKHFYYNAGLYYIQEPSAMIVGEILDVEENDKILDLCAAPGGKSTHIACKLKNKGLVVSNDISASRARAINKNIELLGIKNTVVICENPEKLATNFQKYFNKIIVDAPCSGEGMLASDKNVKKIWNPDINQFYQQKQLNILENAVNMLCDGGSIIYSTCTFSEVENEIVIKKFLDKFGDFELSSIDHNRLNISSGIAKGPQFEKINPYCARILPHKHEGQGHFAAILKNKKTKKNVCYFEGSKDQNLWQIGLFQKFCDENLNINFSGKYMLVENSLYLLPQNSPNFSKIRVLKSGLLLGEIKNKNFYPSQALAMYLKFSDAKRYINFSDKDDNVMRYLKGESFEVDCQDGYALVCVDFFSLGFGKVKNMRLKNKYSKQWIL